MSSTLIYFFGTIHYTLTHNPTEIFDRIQKIYLREIVITRSLGGVRFHQPSVAAARRADQTGLVAEVQGFADIVRGGAQQLEGEQEYEEDAPKQGEDQQERQTKHVSNNLENVHQFHDLATVTCLLNLRNVTRAFARFRFRASF